MRDHLAIYDFYKARMKIELPGQVVISAAGAETVKQNQNQSKRKSKQKSHPPTENLEATF